MDTKALRQKILDLAIRGKLVPQDPNDEPASVLLERIRAEKQQMVKDGKLKAKEIKNDTVIFLGDDNLHYEKFPDGTVNCIEDEIPFELPEGWEWTRLDILTTLVTDYVANGSFATLKANVRTYKEKNYALFVRTVDFANNFEKDLSYIDKESYDFLDKSRLYGGELMLSNIGASIGKVFKIPYFDFPMSLAPNSIILKFHYNTTSDFFEYVFRSFVGQDYLQRLTAGTAMPKFNKTELKQMLVPLPTLTEQERIIAKIKELLSIVDFIESDKTDLQTTIQLTKSKILDLAIRGKLVPQNPDDEPANVLLDRIRAEKEGLIKQGKIKRDKKESVIFKGDDNSYYLRMGNLIETLDDWRINDIPYSWGICCLGEVCDYGNCTNVDTKDIPKTAWILDLEDIEKDTGKVSQKLTLKERNSASTKHSFHKGQVLYSKLRPYLNKVVLVDDDGYCTSEILPLDFNKYILPEYAKYYLMSPTFLRYANHCSYGVKMPRLGTLDGRKAVLIVPPVNEQKRIADKVSQLFSLLDSIADNVN